MPDEVVQYILSRYPRDLPTAAGDYSVSV